MAATFSYPGVYCSIKCSSGRDNQDQNKQKLNNIKINGTSRSTTNVDKLSVGAATTLSSVSPIAERVCDVPQIERSRQNIPTKKQFVDLHRQGLIVEKGVGYRQTVVIRSYEVGADKTATLESILNLLVYREASHQRRYA